jgi:hypothetical protein
VLGKACNVHVALESRGVVVDQVESDWRSEGVAAEGDSF